MIGQQLGPYKIIAEIGQGGMATVYKAHQPSVERDVAIKLIRTNIAGSPEAVQRFQREARLIARLEHIHILPVYDFDGSHEPPYIVMRYLDGGTLKEMMAQGLLSLPEVGRLMGQICAAVDYAHRQGIIHRDLKPSNVLVDREGNTFVTDFGLARLADSHNDDKQLTATGAVMGTADYMSPEQGQGEEELDHRTDIYALGVMLFEMFSGELPFQATSSLKVLAKHVMEPVPSLLALKPDLPPALEEVIAQAMAKDPDDRYASVAALAEALTEALGSATGTQPVPAAPNTVESASNISTPPTLEPQTDLIESDSSIFVAREAELAQLNSFLERALAGQGSLVFVTGEAGAGKTTLITEFTRRAQAAHADLLVTLGSCNDLTGRGDPFLPFREVLAMLMGDVDSGLAKGANTPENARRLRGFLNVSGEALVRLGPLLVGNLIPGSSLLTYASKSVAEKPGWLDKIKKLTSSQEAAKTPPQVEQEQIFEQYTAVLKAVAAKQPLIIWLDDLHWVDNSSASLLFYLVRSLESSPLLVVATYRPEDIAVERKQDNPETGPRQHPLINVINECKRYWGDIQIDLGQTIENEGRQFVDALLDTEPNRLDEAFRQAFFQHTGGQPLFTVELLRDLQEREVLRQDEAGQWMIESPLDWDALPARVEGVIEKRVGRLESDLREALTVASVEGEQFTAEVVAQVREIEARQLVRRLSGELDKQHRLVQVSGLQRVGRQRLSLYQFRHNLIQKYLYNSLDEMEQAYLHEDVANTLEQLYGEQSDKIAVQLALHFEKADLPEEAMRYLLSAGDAAARVYANTEAVAFYDRALALTKQVEVGSEELTHLYLRLGRTLELNSQFDRALTIYKEMEAIAQQHNAPEMRLAALMARASLQAIPSHQVFDLVQGEAASEQALGLAHDLGDQAAEVKILWNLSKLCVFSNRLSQAIDYGERALALARELNASTTLAEQSNSGQAFREQMAFTLNDLANYYWMSGHLNRAKESFREAGDLWRALNNLPMLADSLVGSTGPALYVGDYDLALSLSEEAFEISQSIDNLWGQSYSKIQLGHIYWGRGQPDQAITAMEECIRLSELANYILPQAFTRADLAVIYGSLGALERGLETVQLALTVAETQMPIFNAYALAQLAQLYLWQDNLTEAEIAINREKADPSREAMPIFFQFILLVEAKLAARQGNERALTLTNDLLATLRQFGMRALMLDVLYLQGQIQQDLGQIEAARDCWLEVCREAEAIGSRRWLWPASFALSQLEADPTEANRLRQQARQIVTYIADRTPADLRASFLNLPDVRAVLQSA